jgi:hypothetical protein
LIDQAAAFNKAAIACTERQLRAVQGTPKARSSRSTSADRPMPPGACR